MARAQSEYSETPQGSSAEPTNSLEGNGGEDNLLGPSNGDALAELESLTSGTDAGQSTSGSEDLGGGAATETGAPRS